jgi:hypothetical protein
MATKDKNAEEHGERPSALGVVWLWFVLQRRKWPGCRTPMSGGAARWSDFALGSASASIARLPSKRE